jgi:hypothetical protein
MQSNIRLCVLVTLYIVVFFVYLCALNTLQEWVAGVLVDHGYMPRWMDVSLSILILLSTWFPLYLPLCVMKRFT